MTEDDSDKTSAGSSLIFDLESKPPLHVLLVASAQHTLAMFSGVVMVPLIVANAVGVRGTEPARFINMAILVSGLTTLIQVIRWGPIGSGYLCVMGSSGVFIQPAVIAGKAGGLPLVFGMTLLLSPIEAVMSRLTRLLRALSPAHVTGTIIMLIGLSIIPISITELGGGRGASDFGDWRNIGVGVLTICIIAAASVSRRPVLRVSSVVLGVLVGYAAGVLLGMVDLAPLRAAAAFSVPRPFWAGVRFDLALVLPFVVAYFVTALETFGDMNAIGEISEGGIGKVDERRISGGLLADAVGSCLAGLFGTTANTSYSGNIAMVQLTGVASRRVGICVGTLLIALSFTPKLSAAIGGMPHPVVGGAMIVALAILIGVGMRIATRNALDNVKLLVIGTSIVVGLGVQSVPEICAGCPAWVQTLFRSGTCTGALCAIVLNLVLSHRLPYRENVWLGAQNMVYSDT